MEISEMLAIAFIALIIFLAVYGAHKIYKGK